MKVLVINPGSTSTKIAIYDEVKGSVYDSTIRHNADDLAKFEKIVDQFDYRKKFILEALTNAGITLHELSAIVGRGGLMRPVEGGTYSINQKMLDDLADKSVWGREHASNLGAYLAKSMADEVGIPSFIADPVTVDEMKDVARISGIPEIERNSLFHALNSRACAHKAAKELGKKMEDCSFVIIHMGGGISAVAFEKGRCVDVNNALLGMGPFSPQRAGALPIGPLVEMAYSGKYTQKELLTYLSTKAGLLAYLGTDMGTDIEKRILEGDKKAELILSAMAYQIVKEAGAMFAAMKGKADAVIYTGGLAYSKDFLIPYLKEHLSYMGKQIVYPGEEELPALADAGFRILKGEEKPKEYKGK